MSSEPTRNPVMDHLLTPQNAALVVIDYQPTQINSIKSMDHEKLVANIVAVVKTAKTYGLNADLLAFVGGDASPASR
jgi:hypothetical protein